MNSHKFKFIDLFAGIGGFRLALDGVGGECVFSSDINAECQKTYEANFNEKPFGDITKIDPSDIPDHDILCAGFPCQPFSISGLQRGFEDTRGTLFFNVIEIVRAKKPRVVFLENVKNLKDHDKGRTLQVILKTLRDEGYFVNWQILNAKDFGLAQNRERIIIVGTKNNAFNFNNIKAKANIKIKDILETKPEFSYLNKSEYTILDQKQWKIQKSGLIFCGFRNKLIRVKGTRPDTEHLSRVHKQPNRIYYIEGTHPTIPSQEVSGRFFIYDGKDVRKLTITECFRLQGFPDNYKKVSSMGNLYKQIGNSVAIPMIEAVAKEIVQTHLDFNNHNQISVFNLENQQNEYALKIPVTETLF